MENLNSETLFEYNDLQCLRDLEDLKNGLNVKNTSPFQWTCTACHCPSNKTYSLCLQSKKGEKRKKKVRTQNSRYDIFPALGVSMSQEC